jgi:tellurite resistance protein TerC
MIANSWLESVNVWVLAGFHLVILILLVIDLGFVTSSGQTVSLRQAAAWSLVWIGLASLFAVGIWKYWDLWHPEDTESSSQRALEYVAGYLVEKALSIDNLFVFVVIFRYFQVPAHLQHRVLVWGLVGALILRGAMIVGGIALIQRFHALMYVLGAFVILAGARMCWAGDAQVDPRRNVVLRYSRRLLPVHDSFDSSRLVVRHEGRWYVTPLFLVLLAIESTDVVFALDSIPAVFGITTDPLIVYTSNIFAILGLRSLYFLLAGLLGIFRYLHVGIGVVLLFVGLKMVLGDLYPIPILWSLALIAVTLAAAVAASLLKPTVRSQDGAGALPMEK